MTDEKLKPVKKPDLWKHKTGENKGKLTPQARAYLSYTLKRYYQTGLTKKERVEKIKLEEKEQKLKFIGGTGTGIPLRIWAKFNYSGKDNPIFIEGFVDGFSQEKEWLLEELKNYINQYFNGLGYNCEFGIEEISFIESRRIIVYYGRTANKQRWRRHRA